MSDHPGAFDLDGAIKRAVRRVVKAHKADGWQATSRAARRSGDDEMWGHIYLDPSPRSDPSPTTYSVFAGVYCPTLAELWGFRSYRGRAPGKEQWAAHGLVVLDARVGTLRYGASPSPPPVLPAYRGLVEVNQNDLEEWLVEALDPVLPAVVTLSNHAALFEHSRNGQSQGDLRDALLLGRYLGRGDAEQDLLDRARAVYEEHEQRAIEGGYPAHHDRSKDKRLWSHPKFERYVLSLTPGETG